MVTATTVRTLERQRDFLHRKLDGELSLPSQRVFECFTEGSAIQPNKRQLATSNLAQTEVAIAARKRRQKQFAGGL